MDENFNEKHDPRLPPNTYGQQQQPRAEFAQEQERRAREASDPAYLKGAYDPEPNKNRDPQSQLAEFDAKRQEQERKDREAREQRAQSKERIGRDVEAMFNGMHARLTEFADAAGRLTNKNISDIARSAAGKVKQLIEHHDRDLAAGSLHDHLEEKDIAEREKAAAARAANEDAQARGVPVMGDPRAPQPVPQFPHDDTKRPGDPTFQQRNADFRDPHNVDLNPHDGTLRTAPNALGRTDKRE